MKARLKILYASAEVVPFAKTGGLADVAGALPQVLAQMGHDVRIVMPRYSCIDAVKFAIRPVTDSFLIPHGGDAIPMRIDQSDAIAGVPTYLLANDYLYDRSSLYGQPDDDHRFIAFCRGIIEMFDHLGWVPDVINCNDWHTGLVPVYLKTLYADSPLGDIATLYTIHNLAYQGCFDRQVMELAGLPWELFTWDRLEFWGQINFMKAGLVFADAISTVSEQYAREIQTPEYGDGLEGVMQYRHEDLCGIINGIDYEIWNPRHDALIPATFTPEDRTGKAQCKRTLQEEMGLEVNPRIPLFGLISRLSAQKGLDLLEIALPKLLAENAMQVMVLGTGDEHFHTLLTQLAKAYPEKLAVSLKFDNGLAHRIYAGSDAFLMPSYYEPCGLGQMISLAYGTVPVVRATGGLADTITEIRPRSSKGNGFLFTDYSAKGLTAAVQRALRCYADPTRWDIVMANAFACHYSWQASANKYVKAYQHSMKKTQMQGLTV